MQTAEASWIVDGLDNENEDGLTQGTVETPRGELVWLSHSPGTDVISIDGRLSAAELMQIFEWVSDRARGRSD